MERIIRKDKFDYIACNNIIIHGVKAKLIGSTIDEIDEDWEVIKPKYYRYLDDNSVLEIWYDSIGMLLSGSIKGFIHNCWTDEKREEITYKEAMSILEKEQNKDLSYNNKDLMSRIEDKLEEKNNNGGASDWYSLPENANTLQDLIEHRNMNGSVKDIFKACYRLGIKTEDELRDANKMAYYSLREVGRITGRKDYVTIAKELMGSQAIEKDEKDI